MSKKPISNSIILFTENNLTKKEQCLIVNEHTFMDIKGKGNQVRGEVDWAVRAGKLRSLKENINLLNMVNTKYTIVSNTAESHDFIGKMMRLSNDDDGPLSKEEARGDDDDDLMSMTLLKDIEENIERNGITEIKNKDEIDQIRKICLGMMENSENIGVVNICNSILSKMDPQKKYTN